MGAAAVIENIVGGIVVTYADEELEKRALDREVLSTESAKGEHESDLEHDR